MGVLFFHNFAPVHFFQQAFRFSVTKGRQFQFFMVFALVLMAAPSGVVLSIKAV